MKKIRVIRPYTEKELDAQYEKRRLADAAEDRALAEAMKNRRAKAGKVRVVEKTVYVVVGDDNAETFDGSASSAMHYKTRSAAQTWADFVNRD